MQLCHTMLWNYLIRLAVVFTLTLCIVTSAQSKVEVIEFEDPDKQALYQQMIKELRCLVCQNQNLADSNADLAIDLRRKTRGLIAEGKSRKDVVDYMVTRYGEFVLYRPAFNTSNFFLWSSPILLLLIATWIAVRARNRNKTPPQEFSEEQIRKARKMMTETIVEGDHNT